VRQRFAELRGDVRNVVFRRDRARRLGLAAHHRYDLDSTDLCDGIEMLLAERAGAREHDFQVRSSRIRCPSAVLDAGT
jgi:hypothetical protein